MMETIQLRKIALGAVACFVAGCASTGINVEKPSVSLRTVEVADIGLGFEAVEDRFELVDLAGQPDRHRPVGSFRSCGCRTDAIVDPRE